MCVFKLQLVQLTFKFPKCNIEATSDTLVGEFLLRIKLWHMSHVVFALRLAGKMNE